MEPKKEKFQDLVSIIIPYYKKKEYIITSACWQKCDETKNDLFNLVKSVKF